MSNQRAGKMHAAGMGDGMSIPYRDVLEFVRAARNELLTRCSNELNSTGDDSYLWFEMIEDFLVEDVARGKPFKFSTRVFGL